MHGCMEQPATSVRLAVVLDPEHTVVSHGEHVLDVVVQELLPDVGLGPTLQHHVLDAPCVPVQQEWGGGTTKGVGATTHTRAHTHMK